MKSFGNEPQDAPEERWTEPMPSIEKQEDFYMKLRASIAGFVDSAVGKRFQPSKYLLFAPDIFHLLIRAFGDRSIDRKSKLLIGAGILYFIAPLDFLPEALIGPGGFLDDLAIGTFVVNTLLNKFPPAVLEKYWTGDAALLASLQKLAGFSERTLGKVPAGSLLRRFMR